MFRFVSCSRFAQFALKILGSIGRGRTETTLPARAKRIRPEREASLPMIQPTPKIHGKDRQNRETVLHGGKTKERLITNAKRRATDALYGFHGLKRNDRFSECRYSRDAHRERSINNNFDGESAGPGGETRPQESFLGKKETGEKKEGREAARKPVLAVSSLRRHRRRHRRRQHRHRHRRRHHHHNHHRSYPSLMFQAFNKFLDRVKLPRRKTS